MWRPGVGPSVLLVAKHIPERERGSSAHRITSSHFRMKRTIKMVIFPFTYTITLIFFLPDFSLWAVFKPWKVTWKINTKILFSIGMKVNWSAGEIRMCFPRIPKVIETWDRKNILLGYCWLSDMKLTPQPGKIQGEKQVGIVCRGNSKHFKIFPETVESYPFNKPIKLKGLCRKVI